MNLFMRVDLLLTSGPMLRWLGTIVVDMLMSARTEGRAHVCVCAVEGGEGD